MLNKVRAILRYAPQPFKVCGEERVWGFCGRPAGHDGHHEHRAEPDEHVAALADKVKRLENLISEIVLPVGVAASSAHILQVFNKPDELKAWCEKAREEIRNA